MGFLDNYETVEDRNGKFWVKYPEGRIETEILYQDGTRYVVRAVVYRHKDDEKPAATGHAEEVVTAKGVNQTSALENCETSAEGRALARLGFHPKGARPSREEMQKVERHNGGHPSGQDTPQAARGALAARAKSLGLSTEQVGAEYVKAHKTSLGQETDAAKIRQFTDDLTAQHTQGAA
jgi:hypothetical protein